MSQLDTPDVNAYFFNESVSDWVVAIHVEISTRYGMKIIHIEPNDFGFDSYAAILVAILSNVSSADIMGSIRGQLNKYKYIELAHSAWSQNYIRWKNIRNDKITTNPKKSLNTVCRNDRATTHVPNLDSSSLELYNDIITAVFDTLGKRILDAGMQQLTIG